MIVKLLANYNNGNANIKLFDNGTRVVKCDDPVTNLEFPLSIDLCITKYCNRGCLFCYNNSGVNGKHGNILELPIIDSIPPGVEIAIGGGSITTHPDLKDFLKKLKNKGLIANITVSQGEFIENVSLINEFIEEDLIHGMGISFKEPNDILWRAIADNKNCVVHLIAGVHTKEVLDYLSDFGLKILILGYKDLGRGEYYHDALRDKIDANINWLKDHLEDYKGKFRVISLDNLAVEQLDAKRLVTEEKWEKYFQGEDGSISCYIDGVNETISISSLESENDTLPLGNDIKEDFAKIKALKEKREVNDTIKR